MLTNDKNEKAVKATTNINSTTPKSAKYFRNRGASRKKPAAAAVILKTGDAGSVASASAVATGPPVLQPNANRRAAGANWNSTRSPAQPNINNENNESKTVAGITSQPLPRSQHKHLPKLSKKVAMDCEMVGIGFQGRNDMLARVSIVDEAGKVILDKYVQPVEAVTDFRTHVSGIRPLDLTNGEEFKVVQNEVKNILKDRILVGHNVTKDLMVLKIKHPYRLIRDTSNYRPLAKLALSSNTPSLKHLSAKILGCQIQTGEHNSIEDAKAAMDLYCYVADAWEKCLAKKNYRKH